MSSRAQPIRIVVADDDADDRLLMQEAFEEIRLRNPVDYVRDGEDLMDYLHRKGPYEPLKGHGYPGLILLDLNMPRKDGRTALAEIRQDPALCCIPVVVFTTSKSEEDIVRTYGLGVSSFIAKPVTFDSLVSTVRIVSHYWFEIVSLPPECRDRIEASRT